MTLPLLYTFRRCPYAIRARLAIAASGIELEQREVSLRNKPAAMLAISPKGTVPVLQLANGQVLEQSLDIMRWALALADPLQWLPDAALAADTEALITRNDGAFKHWLDRYKYPERHPELAQSSYRQEAEVILANLDARLARHGHLVTGRTTLADAALFPFVRQFAAVDTAWFDTAPYPALRHWLNAWLASPLFATVMAKTD
ncbi:glutathione S-transferase [Chitinolyticbacter albus]|uniref:glutathione S-transferase n=1 Tax=Chitinolyticbacter albus TaxID=2961951 RepID=UPI002109A154|nr:glutathione S-transferase [Chitinolyticbacter albus]